MVRMRLVNLQPFRLTAYFFLVSFSEQNGTKIIGTGFQCVYLQTILIFFRLGARTARNA